ncbi:hypothetical protein MSAN_01520900 [Mycena sanguinolenta]|uniref:Uncharacterized protein n=1 Tax=Mycena sanguinolenta TaxID=230812 RepID=A0A8H6Y399_9AGAR|nr:hypothetical protein MSAN_01520900 [Mycena sanguinolenta]
MDLQPRSDSEFSIVSTDSAAVHPGLVSEGSEPTSDIKLFVNPFSFLSSFFGGLRGNSELPKPTGNNTRNDSETRGRFTTQTIDHLVTNNYNYYNYISGGVGGAGGVGRDHGIGGGGGAGYGPTLNFYAPPREEQSEFRTIRQGDIKLRKQIGSESYHVVDFQNRLCREAVVRRVYSGEIRGDPGPVTVTMYEGDWAEERWRQDVAKYAAIRNPYIMQLYGLVNTRTLRAMVFHDGADHEYYMLTEADIAKQN